VNQPGPAFTVIGIDEFMDSWMNGDVPSNRSIQQSNNPPAQAIRIPVTRVKGLGEKTKDRILNEFGRGPFASLRDFYERVVPSADEMEALIRVGAFDGFGQSRTAQFWEYQAVAKTRQSEGFDASGQGWLLPPPKVECPPEVREPGRGERLVWETELLDFPASGHPLELHDDIAWDTYCPVSRLGEFVGQEVVTCGLVIEQRVHHQVTGEPMKFLTLADWTGMVETELFAATYRSYSLATVRYPVLEITARVEPFENGRGHSLRVMRAGKPRAKAEGSRQKEQ
jgi:DNA polymerase III alpha subunit